MQRFDVNRLDAYKKEQLNTYYAYNAKKLHKITDRILRKFGGIHDAQEYYSLANEVFLKVLMNYDSERGNFEGFLYSCLYKRICSYITKGNRKKRKNVRTVKQNGKEEKIFLQDISFDAPLSGDDGEKRYLKDVLASDYILEDNLDEMRKSEKVDAYLEKLSRKQRVIVELLMRGEPPGKIRKKLGLTEKEYANQMEGIRSHRNTKLLF